MGSSVSAMLFRNSKASLSSWNPDAIVKAALRHRCLGKNYMAKIPVIPSGVKAIETMVTEDIPICATEVFSISQTVYVGELYEQAAEKYDLN